LATRLSALTPAFLEFIPEELEPAILYVSERFQVSLHLCACGCREKTVLPFGSPQGWEYTREGDVVTFNPSIGNYQVPCRSHYYIHRNEIRWV
jgi:hypothetical protein